MNFRYKKLYFDGQLKDASTSEKHDVVCPGDERVVAQIAWASKQDAYDSLESAKKGFEYWSQLNANDRSTWMLKLRDAIIQKRDFLREAIMHEMGKTWEVTDEDLTSLIDSLAYYSKEIHNWKNIPIKDKEGTHSHYIQHQPVGVVVAFLAYNFPLLNLGFKLGPALASGCSIILKPSDFSPLSAYLIGEICHSISFPAGVINVICGDVKEVGVTLSKSKIPRLITMIGSTDTAQKLIQQSSKTSLKRYSMECGGNAPFIVFPDANLSQALDIAKTLKIWNTGQICVAPNRFFIHESIIDSFTEGLVEKFSKVKIGFNRSEKPDMGPLANKQSVFKVKSIIDQSLNENGKLLFGGGVPDKKGYFIEPTIIRMEDNNADVLQKEIFGPVAIIVPFSNKEEVLELANNTNVGLASYVFSSNNNTLDYFAENLEFGEIQFNGVKYDIYLPHGGIKNSGVGFDCSPYALDDYLVKKRISKKMDDVTS
jgi:succinate-semialdehyde dehydrogenase/glutarate-semialdehyde dehydrogenase